MTKEKQEHLILQIKYAFLALIVGICVGIVDTVYSVVDYWQFLPFALPIINICFHSFHWQDF